MIKNGKLIWSHNLHTKNWRANALDNEDRMYVIVRDYHGGYSLTVSVRFGDEPQELGWHRLIRDAKQEADRHHHARILESDDENLKAYIAQYPIPS